MNKLKELTKIASAVHCKIVNNKSHGKEARKVRTFHMETLNSGIQARMLPRTKASNYNALLIVVCKFSLDEIEREKFLLVHETFWLLLFSSQILLISLLEI